MVQGDASDPAVWSGVPAGLRRGFDEAGVEVEGVSALFSGSRMVERVDRRTWAQRSASPAWARLSSAAADRAIRRRPGLAGVVMIGSGYSIHTSLPTLTYDDMTIDQAISVGDEHVSRLLERALVGWRARQAGNYRRMQACCMMSSWAAESVVRDYGVPPHKVHSVGAGRNVRPTHVERNWSPPRYLFVGRDWQRKRGDAVVRAFRRVRERHPDAVLHLVGGHPRIEVAGVIGHGTLSLASQEARNAYCRLLESSTCFVMPSRFEPLGIAYVEAATAGIPSIGTTVGGALEAVGEGGRLVDPGDDDALTGAMLELANPQLAQRLGELGRGRADLFTWRAVAERMLRALELPGVDVDSLAPFLDSGAVSST